MPKLRDTLTCLRSCTLLYDSQHWQRTLSLISTRRAECNFENFENKTHLCLHCKRIFAKFTTFDVGGLDPPLEAFLVDIFQGTRAKTRSYEGSVCFATAMANFAHITNTQRRHGRHVAISIVIIKCGLVGLFHRRGWHGTNCWSDIDHFRSHSVLVRDGRRLGVCRRRRWGLIFQVLKKAARVWSFVGSCWCRHVLAWRE